MNKVLNEIVLQRLHIYELTVKMSTLKKFLQLMVKIMKIDILNI